MDDFVELHCLWFNQVHGESTINQKHSIIPIGTGLLGTNEEVLILASFTHNDLQVEQSIWKKIGLDPISYDELDSIKQLSPNLYKEYLNYYNLYNKMPVRPLSTWGLGVDGNSSTICVGSHENKGINQQKYMVTTALILKIHTDPGQVFPQYKVKPYNNDYTMINGINWWLSHQMLIKTAFNPYQKNYVNILNFKPISSLINENGDNKDYYIFNPNIPPDWAWYNYNQTRFVSTSLPTD